MHGKRKKEYREEESSRPQKKKKKAATFLDEDEVPLSELHKSILLKDMFGVVQQSPKASDTPTTGKLPKVRILFVFDSINSERILPTQPPPVLQPIPSPSQRITNSQPPPTKTPFLKPVTKTPQVSETRLQQQQQISQTSPPSELPSSPIPPPSQIVYAPYIENPNITTPSRYPSRDSGNQVSEGTPEGMFNF